MRGVKLITKVDLGSGEYRICEFPGQERQPRRSIDDYQTKLLHRAETRRSTVELDRQPPLSSVPTKKQIAKKMGGSSLRLSVVGVAHQAQSQTQRKTQKRSNPKLLLLRNTANFFSLATSQHLQDPTISSPLIEDQFLLAHSCRVRLLHNAARNRTLYLILSVDFIINEQNFWQEEEPNESAVRTWRKLINIANVVWTVRKQKTLKKLQLYCQRMLLPLDVVYLLEPKKNRMSIAVNYRPLKEELQIADSSRILVCGMVETEEPDKIDSYDLLENKLPIIGHRLTSIHLVRAKQGAVAFGHLPSLLKRPPKLKIDPSEMLEKYRQYISKWESDIPARRGSSTLLRRYNFIVNEQAEPFSPLKPIDTLQRIETLKREWTNWITQMNTLSQRPSQIQGDSVPFIVGDMLRRNYPLLDKHYHRETSPRKRQQLTGERHKRNAEAGPHSASHPPKQISYSFPIFLWSF